MQTQTKLIGAALALGALGLWGLLDRPTSTDSSQFEATLNREADLAPPEELTERELALGTQSPGGRKVAAQEPLTKGSKASAVNAAEYFLTGRVLDDGGHPRSDARLVLATLNLNKSEQELLCGEGGWYRGPSLLAGAYSLEVQAPGCIPFRSGLTIAKDEPRELPDIVLQRGRELRGRVVDESGAGIASAEVVLLEQPVSFEAVSVRRWLARTRMGSLCATGCPGPNRTWGSWPKAGCPRAFSLRPCRARTW